MKKKLVAIISVVAMLVTCMPTVAWANVNGNVCEISGKGYPNLDDALADAGDGATIKVIDDINLTSNVIIEKDVTLDLNGFTIEAGTKTIKICGGDFTIEDTSAAESGVITGTKHLIDMSIAVNGKTSSDTVTFKSGTLDGKSSQSFVVYVGSGDTFNMDGGKAIQSNGGSKVVQLYGGTACVTGGSIEGKYSGIYVANASSKVVVGEEVEGKQTEEDANKVYVCSVSNNASESTVILNSGTVGKLLGSKWSVKNTLNAWFEQDVSEKLPDGMYCVQQEGHWEVVEGELTEETAYAKIGDKLYGSIIQAANNIKNGETVTLLKDYVGSSSIKLDAYNATIDLNGHSITNNSENGFGIEIKTSYGNEEIPTGGVKITNSSDILSKIYAYTPIFVRSGDSQKTILLAVEGNIVLQTEWGDDEAIRLGTGAYMEYDDTVADLIQMGGFLSTSNDGKEYVYGSFTDAAERGKDYTATLLNDYQGKISVNKGDIKYVLDLNKKTVISWSEPAIQVNCDGASLTVKNGSMLSDGTGVEVGIPAQNAGALNNIELILEDINLSAGGTDDTDYGIVTNGTSEKIDITLKNSSISAAQIGVYYPVKSGNLNIENTNITGSTGVAVKGGTVNISGNEAEIYGTGSANPAGAIFSGVTDTGDAVYVETNYDRDVSVNIESGTFVSNNGYAVQMSDVDSKGDNKIIITGGYFSDDPSEFIPTEKKAEIVSGGDRNLYHVTDIVEEASVDIAAGDPEVKTEGMDAEEANAVKESLDKIDASGSLLAIADSNRVEMVGNTTAEDAINALKGKYNEPTDSDNLTIVVEPYLKIAVNSYNNESLSMDITAMYRLKATTAANVAGMTEENSAPIPGTEKVLNTTEPVTITVPLPDKFVTDAAEHVYVQHKGIYEYVATVASGGETGFTATFTNPHGFSTFDFTKESQTVATIDGTSYLSLQKAVNAVKDGETIVLTKDNDENVTVKKAVKFTLNKDSKNFTGKISAGSGYQLTESGGVYTVTVKQNTGGGTVTPSVTKSRVAGDDRFETAIKVADKLKSELGVVKFNNIVVANSDEFADALSATALAADKNAPILVVNKNNESTVKTYIANNLNKGGNVYQTDMKPTLQY